MSNTMSTLAVVELPVFTTAIFAVAGYVWKRQEKKHTEREQQLSAIDRKLTRMITQRANGLRRLYGVEETVKVHSVRIQRLQENLAIVTAEVERQGACADHASRVASSLDGTETVNH